MTLLEVMLAIGIVAVAFLSIILVFANGIKLMGQSTQFTEATQVAKSFLEVTRRRGYAAITPGIYDGRVPTPPNAGTQFPPAPYPKLTVNNGEYTLVVEASNASLPANLLAVKVDVYWNTNRSKVTMQTYVRP